MSMFNYGISDEARRDMINMVNDLYYEGKITNGEDGECVGCPFEGTGKCSRYHLWAGCAKWEEDMGEDL